MFFSLLRIHGSHISLQSCVTRLQVQICPGYRENYTTNWGKKSIYKLGKPLYKLGKAVLTNFGNSVSQYLGTVDAKIRFPSVKNSELTNVFHLKPGVVHAYFTHCQEFLSCSIFYLPGPFTFICFHILSLLLCLELVWIN